MSIIPNLKELTLGKKIFKVIEKIGRGKYATLFKASYNGGLYALKVFRYDDSNEKKRLKAVSREYKGGLAISELNYSFFIRTLPYNVGRGVMIYRGKEIRYFVIVQEFIEGYSTTVLPNQRSTIIRSLIKSVRTLHKSDFVHRDIKPKNFLINEHDEFKLIDFGFVVNLEDDQGLLLKRYGTPSYMPPTISDKDLPVRKRAVFFDLWSVGSSILKILTGHTGSSSKSLKDDRLSVGKEQVDYLMVHRNEIDESIYDFVLNFCFFCNSNNEFDRDLIESRVDQWLGSFSFNL